MDEVDTWNMFAAHAISGILSRNLHANMCGNNHVQHSVVGGCNPMDAVKEAATIADMLVKESDKRFHE